MSDWRVQRHYGFGAARVFLQPQPHLASDASLSFAGAMRDAGADFTLSALPPILLAAFVCSALFLTVSKNDGYTDLEVAMIQRDVLELAEEVPQPLPPEVIEKEPEPPPVRVVEKKPEPPPRARQIAEVKPIAKPRPPRPQIEALAMAPAPAPPSPPPARRGNRVRESVRPKMNLAPMASVPSLKQADAPKRSRRFAAVRVSPNSKRPKADLGPPIAARSLSAPEPAPPPVRTRRAAPRSAAEKRRAAHVSFAAAAPPLAELAEQRSSPRRSRPVGQPERARRAAPPPIQPALAAAAPAAARSDLPDARRRTFGRDRTSRNAATRARDDHTGSRALAGVPLASLAACVSDREEDALKRKLVAAVTTQRECVSPAGTYRFVETKNLNAFLMTIERAPGRPVADRCAELTYALECAAR